MSEPLLRVLARMRGHLLDPDTLVKAVASGRQRASSPAGSGSSCATSTSRPGATCRSRRTTTRRRTPPTTPPRRAPTPGDAVDELLDEPFGNWHVETTTQSHQVRVTKKLEALVHTTERAEQVEVDRGHDRDKERLLAEDDPVFKALGLTDAEGRMKPSRHAKYRQVEEFLRLLDTSISDAVDKRHLRRPTPERAAADRRPRVRQRLPHLRRAALPDRGPRPAGAC